MSLFDIPSLEDVNQLAKKSVVAPKKSHNKQELNQSPSSIKAALDAQSKEVLDYFKDSNAILITDKEQLHNYVTQFIDVGIGGIDTETTGLDLYEDHVVGASLYYPGGVECYIPMKHIVPIFEEPYKNQLTYDEVKDEFERFNAAKTKLIYANASFDLAMMYNSIGVDLSKITYYDVLVAWRCIYGAEKKGDNALKVLYNKYVLGGKGNPKKFSDFFSPKLYPYSKPEVAKLYAANDAKITYELYEWQLDYCKEDREICQKKNLQAVSKLIWQVEFPMIKECFELWKNGLYFDAACNRKLLAKYQPLVDAELETTIQMVKEILDATPNYQDKIGKRKLFTDYKDFNPLSPEQVAILLYDIMGIKKPVRRGKETRSTDKEALTDINMPIANQILKYRGKVKLVNDFIEKTYDMVQKDHKIHAQFNQLGADTGRMSCEKPNLQQIPSRAKDIRHMFRATPGYVMISSDYSSQEPRIAAYVSQDKGMIQAFKDNKDIYSAIASMSFNLPYEQCLENNPETGEYQPDGYKRRNEAKKIVLGVLYGRSVPSIAEQLYGDDKDMSDKEKTAKAQKIYDAVLNNFSGLKHLMIAARNSATRLGYTETILGRRKYLPDLQLPEFAFTPMSNYVNPYIDPMDVHTLNTRNEIPMEIQKQMLNQLKSCQYNGERYALIEKYYNAGIQTTDNRKKIQDSVRQVVNGIVQGCLGGDTLIQTKEFGIVKISEVVGQTLHIWDGNDWTLGTITYSGKKQKCVVELTGGLDIVCSPTHKFLVRNTRGNDQFVECQKLLDREHSNSPSRVVINSNYSTSDYVYNSDTLNCAKPIVHNANNFTLSDIHNRFDLGLYLGRLASDGSYLLRTDGGSCATQIIAEHEFSILPKLSQIMSCWNYSVNERDSGGNRTQRMKYLSVFSKSLVDEITALDIKHQIHKNIFMDTEVLRGFVCGFFDGDSGITGKTIRLVFGKQYDFYSMCKDIQKALAFFGVRSRVKSWSDRYVVDIVTYDNQRFLDVIGFMNPEKQSKGRTLTSVKDEHIFGHCSLVSSVTITDEYIDMYDVCNTDRGYFVANGMITHNSAADQTKLAMLRLSNTPRWHEIGGRLVIQVHDELIAEVPIEHMQEGGEILSQSMKDAANYLPFPSKCDVTTSIRWNGLEFPCPYTKPDNVDIDNLSEDEIKWLQYQLAEMEYTLPVLDKEARGNAARGVNGKVTDELKAAFENYKSTYGVTDDTFVEHIEKQVIYGGQLV